MQFLIIYHVSNHYTNLFAVNFQIYFDDQNNTNVYINDIAIIPQAPIMGYYFFFPWKNALIQKKHKELITNYNKDKRIDVQHYMEVFQCIDMWS